MYFLALFLIDFDFLQLQRYLQARCLHYMAYLAIVIKFPLNKRDKKNPKVERMIIISVRSSCSFLIVIPN